MPVRRVLGEERPLLLREQLAQRPLAQRRSSRTLAVARRALERCRADEAAGHRVHLDAEARRASAASGGSSAGTTGRSFTTESSPFPCDPPGAHDHARSFQRQVGRVEEEHLADLRPRAGPCRARRRPSADRASGTVSFSSTLSAPLIRPSSSCELLVRAGLGHCGSHGWGSSLRVYVGSGAGAVSGTSAVSVPPSSRRSQNLRASETTRIVAALENADDPLLAGQADGAEDPLEDPEFRAEQDRDRGQPGREQQLPVGERLQAEHRAQPVPDGVGQEDVGIANSSAPSSGRRPRRGRPRPTR